MRAVLLIGDHPRHLHVARRIHQAQPLAGLLIEKREAFVPTPPPALADRDRENFERHFANRHAAEARYFGSASRLACPVLEVDPARFNGPGSAAFVRECAADIALVFGTPLIVDPLRAALPSETVNLHLGLSPRYRGAATLFWPFYFLEPDHAGCTFHYLTPEADAGAIVHQAVPEMRRGDRIHDVACRTVLVAAEAAVELLARRAHAPWIATEQRGTGKKFLSRDFRPEHLRLIYDLFDDDIVDRYLDGELTHRPPRLVHQPL